MSDHCYNNTATSNDIYQSAMLSNSTTPFSSKDGKIVTRSQTFVSDTTSMKHLMFHVDKPSPTTQSIENVSDVSTSTVCDTMTSNKELLNNTGLSFNLRDESRKCNSIVSKGSTATAHKQISTVLCNTPEKDTVQPAGTITELETTEPQSQSFKLSRQISQHPNKFPVNKVNCFDILMAAQKTPRKKSSSKRLDKNSPIKYMRNNRSPWKNRTTSPLKANASKILKFDNCCTETTSESLASTEPENQSSVTNFSFSQEYVTYFESIIANVLRDRDMLTLISEEELKVILNFQKLETQVKKLYIRMLSRKYTWHRVSDIKYNDINVPAAFKDLEMAGLVTSDYSSEEFEVILNMLKLPELKSLCQSFQITSAIQRKTKLKLVQAVLEYRRKQQTIIGNQRSEVSPINSRLREVLGHCIKLCAEGREGFRHIVLLFSLPHQNDDDDRESSKQILLLHYVKTKKVEYPAYKVLKTRPVFSSRDHFIRFEKANELLIGLMKAISAKHWNEAQVYGQCARKHFKTLIEDSTLTDLDKTLPLFIRRYTAGSTYAYAMTKAIEAFRKSKDQIPECVIILQELLHQNVYLPQFRGRWYDQLALLLHVHLKNFEQAAEIVIEAMKDDCLNEVHQQILSSRGVLLCKKDINNVLKQRLKANINRPLKHPLCVTIKAKSLQANAPGRKQVYIQEDRHKQEITYSSVEEYALSHYRSEGYIKGVALMKEVP